MWPRHIAVLGGGITGLSSALHLSRKFPGALITLLEKECRFGGWIRSDRVTVKDEHGTPYSILLEAGPRTLRPNSKSLLELIHLLGIEDTVIKTSKTSPAARYRFLHIPGRPGLLTLPSSPFSIFASPLCFLLISAVWRDISRPYNRPDSPDNDESFDDFLTRRLGEPLARVLGSSLVHGIYAADSRLLSVRAAFPTLWETEERGSGRLTWGVIRSSRRVALDTEKTYELGNTSLLKDCSVYTFRDGMRTLPLILEQCLKVNSNVNLRFNTGVSSLRIREDSSFELLTSSGESLHPTHVVSTLPLPRLQAILPPSSLPHLTTNPTSSVTVVNFIFPSSPAFHPDGFGYLIPRPEAGYEARESPGILGTVFDSCAAAEQDELAPYNLTTRKPPIKLTMMLGGPYKSIEESIPNLLLHLSSHLGISRSSIPEPLYARIHRHSQCIPTPTSGHLKRMEELRGVLKGHPWEGRLEVIGAGVGGVSVGDCAEAARDVGNAWLVSPKEMIHH